jgi:hypothetical protein
MEQVNRLLTRLYVVLTTPPARDEHGDVPGWVLITVMTAGLVTMIYTLAKSQLRKLITDALSGITG